MRIDKSKDKSKDKGRDKNLDAVFKALGDANRRSLLDSLQTKDGQTLSELCSCLKMTRQAVSKHLILLEAASLVITQKEGRYKLHFINSVPLQDAGERWLDKFATATPAAPISWSKRE